MGTPVADLDTPCLLVDLDALEHNQQVIADTYRNTVCKMGHHVKNTKCPLLVHMQFRAGGTDQRICCAKVSEAEVMVEGGIRDIFIVNQIVTEDKIARLCSLARRAAIRVAIDDPENLRALSTAAQRHGVDIGVLIEVATSGAPVRDTVVSPGWNRQGGGAGEARAGSGRHHLQGRAEPSNPSRKARRADSALSGCAVLPDGAWT